MNRWLLLSGGFVSAALLTCGLAFGQTTAPKAECKKGAPEKVEGQVVSVSPDAGKVTVRDNKGQTHEFQASKETIQDMKPGDKIEAKLRDGQKC
jgi:hypothetical protein